MSSFRLIPGGLHRDARGAVQHVNAFRPANADRFYVIHPADSNLRGWVGHRRETKWFFAVSGVFEIGVVAPIDWANPSAADEVAVFRLNAEEPAVLEVLPGCYTGIRAIRRDGEPESQKAGEPESRRAGETGSRKAGEAGCLAAGSADPALGLSGSPDPSDPGAALLVFSTGSIESAKEDDFRLPAEFWRM